MLLDRLAIITMKVCSQANFFPETFHAIRNGINEFPNDYKIIVFSPVARGAQITAEIARNGVKGLRLVLIYSALPGITVLEIHSRLSQRKCCPSF